MKHAKRLRWAAVFAAVVVFGMATPATATSPAKPTVPDVSVDQDRDELSESDKEFIEFVESHPGEYAAQDQLAQELFGSRLYVQFEGLEREVTGERASVIVDDTKTMGGLPPDIFAASISRSSISSGMWVGGHTTFRSDWAGQAAPYDVGSLQFSAPSCVTLNSHAIATSPRSSLGFLSDANVGAKSPIWKVNDYMSGFVMQAKNITASVVLKKSGCSGSQSISSAWRYEANQSGSLSSISAGFGFLSISYSGSTLSVQKSSSVMNFSF